MSHFLTGIILPKVYDGQDIEAYITDILAPYDENVEVAPHDEPCWCVGRAADTETWQETEATLGSLDTERDKYWALPEHERPEWEVIVTPYKQLQAELIAKHPLQNAADPDCDDCHGTGIHTTTYNPQAKWDWWRIGGRWDGLTSSQGERRVDAVDKGFNWGDEHESLEQNSCLVRELKSPYPLYALVTPDGEWHERGEMGWFGQAAHEKSKDAWQDEVAALLAPYSDYLIIGVDCHI